MEPRIFKFSGAGNTFIVLDGRGLDVNQFRKGNVIAFYCTEYSTDGLMILSESPSYDFCMEFYNPDGSGGMMCGNGGRCIAAFADMIGIKPANGKEFSFLAPDGPHTALVVSHSTPKDWVIRLGMKDVSGIQDTPYGCFMDTGTRHLVKFVPDTEAIDVNEEGKLLRWKDEFAPVGTNVNFVQVTDEGIRVRTFEKGVEGETLACGTGITASAIAAHHIGTKASELDADGRIRYKVRARVNDLSVDFMPDYSSVYLTGPATLLF